MKKIDLLYLAKSIVMLLAIALVPNALASSETHPDVSSTEISVGNAGFSKTPIVVMPEPFTVIGELHGQVIEFNSTQEWFESYEVVLDTKPESVSEPSINTSQQTPNIGLSDSEQDFYEWVLDNLSYAANTYISHGNIIKDVTNFFAEQFGIEIPEITTIDGLIGFTGQFVAGKVTEFLTYVFDAIWNGIASMF